jgi:hypothetical protein
VSPFRRGIDGEAYAVGTLFSNCEIDISTARPSSAFRGRIAMEFLLFSHGPEELVRRFPFGPNLKVNPRV